MTPKEKAVDLIGRMLIDDCDDHYDVHSMCSHMAKSCAIIAVDEILLSHKNEDGSIKDIEKHSYWVQVMSEIQLS